MSKSQQKRLAKEAEKAKKAAEKAAAKAAEAAAQPAAKPKAAAADDDEMDSTKYKEMREAWIRSRKAADLTPYPHKFHTTHTHAAYIKEFSGLAAGERLETEAAIAGRVMLKRESGAKLVFFDLVADGLKVQVLADASIYTGPDFTADMLNIKRGDVIGVRGRPGKSKKGELSILPTTVQMLSPCLHQLPKREITDKEVRYRQRYLDLIVNRPVRDIFLMRTRAINFLRRFLDMHHFIEVETPVLNLLPGGATARPFESYHNELQRKLYMRIAPELFLKMLVVGGLDRVYEIGRLFRNEGIDMTHNPEFTSCEFYWAYADYHDLMAFTEELLSSMVKELTGSYKIAIHPDGDKSGRAVEIDFTPPFRRLPMIKSLEEKLGVKFPADLGQPGAHAFLAEQCKVCARASGGGRALGVCARASAGRRVGAQAGRAAAGRAVAPATAPTRPVASPRPAHACGLVRPARTRRARARGGAEVQHRGGPADDGQAARQAGRRAARGRVHQPDVHHRPPGHHEPARQAPPRRRQPHRALRAVCEHQGAV